MTEHEKFTTEIIDQFFRVNDAYTEFLDAPLSDLPKRSWPTTRLQSIEPTEWWTPHWALIIKCQCHVFPQEEIHM